MNPTHPETLPVAAGQLPAVPLTLEGYATLHQMMRFRWTAWRATAENVRREIAAEAAKLLAEMEARSDGQSALFSLLGHKGRPDAGPLSPELRPAQSGRARLGAASTAMIFWSLRLPICRWLSWGCMNRR
jgi:hypothetical protein